MDLGYTKWHAPLPWRIVWSSKHNRPFFYNQDTNIGQWEPMPSGAYPLDVIRLDEADDDDTPTKKEQQPKSSSNSSRRSINIESSSKGKNSSMELVEIMEEDEEVEEIHSSSSSSFNREEISNPVAATTQEEVQKEQQEEEAAETATMANIEEGFLLHEEVDFTPSEDSRNSNQVRGRGRIAKVHEDGKNHTHTFGTHSLSIPFVCYIYMYMHKA
jgi:hypothetical protein